MGIMAINPDFIAPYWREVGLEKWVEDEEKRYVCPECGNVLFRGPQGVINVRSSWTLIWQAFGCFRLGGDYVSLCLENGAVLLGLILFIPMHGV